MAPLLHKYPINIFVNMLYTITKLYHSVLYFVLSTLQFRKKSNSRARNMCSKGICNGCRMVILFRR